MAKMRRFFTPQDTELGMVDTIADVHFHVGKPGDKGIVADVQLVQFLLSIAIERYRSAQFGPLLDSRGRPITRIDVDGICGHATREAILAYQKRQNRRIQDVVADGVVTPSNGTTESTDQGHFFTIFKLNLEYRNLVGADLNPDDILIEPLRTALLTSVSEAQFA